MRKRGENKTLLQKTFKGKRDKERKRGDSPIICLINKLDTTFVLKSDVLSVLIIIKMVTARFKNKAILERVNFACFYRKTETKLLKGQSFGSFLVVSKRFNQLMTRDKKPHVQANSHAFFSCNWAGMQQDFKLKRF